MHTSRTTARTRRRTSAALAAATLGLVAPMLSAVGPAQAAGITYISFEDVDLSCQFAGEAPLRGRYAAAKFSGPSSTDGGAVLDSCSGFGVSPRTGSRFLAFNSALPAVMSNGGTPVGPERITFPTRQKKVTVWVSQGGSPGTATFKMVARRGTTVVRTATATTTTSAWLELTVGHRRGISSVTVNATADPNGQWVLDDLTTVS